MDRNPRSDVPDFCIDFDMQDPDIEELLIKKFPSLTYWELDNTHYGWVYGGTKVLARLVHTHVKGESNGQRQI